MKTLNFVNFFGRSKKCRGPARALFKTKYNGHIFGVIGEFVENENETIVENDEMKNILIRNVNVIKIMLDTFDGLIPNLAFNFEDIEPIDGYEIVKYLNTKQLDSFTSLGFWNSKGNMLDEWKSVFPNVKILGFSSSSVEILKIPSDNPKLCQLVPKLENLELDYTRVSDWQFFGNRFKQLQSLKVQLPRIKNQNRPDETHVLALLKHSKEVDDFTVANTNLKMLKGINEILPDLKNLAIGSLSEYYADERIEKVEFKNVRYLQISTKKDAVPEKIFFNGPEELSLNIQFNSKWIEFISTQVKDVKSLILDSNTLSNEDLEIIGQHLPHLANIKIGTKSKFLANDIVDFVEINNELDLFLLETEMDAANEFADLFSKPWDVTVLPLSDSKRVHIVIMR